MLAPAETPDLQAALQSIIPNSARLMVRNIRTRPFAHPEKIRILPTCALWTILIYLPGWLWWPLERFPVSIESVLGLAFDLSIIFVGFYLALKIYVDAQMRLPEVLTSLECKEPKSPIKPNNRIREILVIVFFAVFTSFLAIVAFNKNFGSTTIAHITGLATAVVLGLIFGDWAYFFCRIFGLMAAIVKDGNCNLNPLTPSKTAGLRDLFHIATRFTATSMILLTVPLTIGLIYILQAKLVTLDVIIFCYVAILIVIWTILLIPFRNVLNTIATATRNTRNRTVGELQNAIHERYGELLKLTGTEDKSPLLLEIKNALDLISLVENGTLLPIDLRGIGRLALTIGVPLIPIIIASLQPAP